MKPQKQTQIKVLCLVAVFNLVICKAGMHAFRLLGWGILKALSTSLKPVINTKPRRETKSSEAANTHLNYQLQQQLDFETLIHHYLISNSGKNLTIILITSKVNTQVKFFITKSSPAVQERSWEAIGGDRNKELESFSQSMAHWGIILKVQKKWQGDSKVLDLHTTDPGSILYAIEYTEHHREWSLCTSRSQNSIPLAVAKQTNPNKNPDWKKNP